MATPYQRGQADHSAGVCRFENPHPMGSADAASWRRGWDSMANAARITPPPTSFGILHNNMNYEGR